MYVCMYVTPELYASGQRERQTDTLFSVLRSLSDNTTSNFVYRDAHPDSLAYSYNERYFLPATG